LWFSQHVGLIYEYVDQHTARDGDSFQFKTIRALNKSQGAWVINRYNEIRRARGEQAGDISTQSGQATIPEFPIEPIVADTTTNGNYPSNNDSGTASGGQRSSSEGD
jgi:hypothetical protein